MGVSKPLFVNSGVILFWNTDAVRRIFREWMGNYRAEVAKQDAKECTPRKQKFLRKCKGEIINKATNETSNRDYWLIQDQVYLQNALKNRSSDYSLLALGSGWNC